MEIPLVLVEKRDGRLVYAIPLWFRILMAAIALLVVASFAVSGEPPGVVGWIVLAAVALAALYEERWTFDAGRGLVSHRAGLLVVARTTEIGLASVERFRAEPFVRGTIPGTEDERAENARALSGDSSGDLGQKRRSYKKAYIRLVCEGSDGSRWLVNMVPDRRREAIFAVASRIASYCGVEFAKGLAE